MEIIDISVPIDENLPTWPGDPEVRVEWFEEIGKGSDVNISKVSFGVHAGTHIDAPLHFIEGGAGLDELRLEDMIGLVHVVEIPYDVDVITALTLQALPEIIYPRVLFKTRNSQLWASKRPNFQRDYVGMDESAAQILADQGVKLIGIDYLSIAPYEHTAPAHELLLRRGIIILEGVDLSQAQAGIYQLICLPLKLTSREGAPVRAVLLR
ncbi:MAG: cyclase family protein [Anaerolineaceae bacterium]